MSASPEDSPEGSAAGLDGLRVLIVIDRVEDVGGAEGSTTLLLRGLHEHGVPVAAVGLDGVNIVDRDRLVGEGVQFFQPPGAGLLPEVRCVLGAIREAQPTLIHSTLARSDMAARIAGRITGVPVMTSIVNVPYGREANALATSRWKLEAYRMIDGFLGRHATFRFHSISAASADEAVRALRIKRERITIVPRGRSDEKLGRATPERRRQMREELGIPDEAFVLVNVAREDVQKGQTCLVETLAAANRACDQPVHLVGAGRRGSASDELDRRFTHADLDHLVHRLGVRTDIPDVLSAGDIFVFPSYHEGLGGALLEALAMELPIVTFDDPAIREAVGDAGVVVPMRDCSAFAAATTTLLANPTRRAQLAAQGRARFEACFTNGRYISAMLSLYATVWSAARCDYRDPLRFVLRSQPR